MFQKSQNSNYNVRLKNVQCLKNHTPINFRAGYMRMTCDLSLYHVAPHHAYLIVPSKQSSPDENDRIFKRSAPISKTLSGEKNRSCVSAVPIQKCGRPGQFLAQPPLFKTFIGNRKPGKQMIDKSQAVHNLQLPSEGKKSI